MTLKKFKELTERLNEESELLIELNLAQTVTVEEITIVDGSNKSLIILSQ